MQSIASAFKKHRLYEDFVQVRQRLAAHQFVCWVAGGAVRDWCLGRNVSDLDLVTDACTDALKQIFPEAILVGESFGVLKLPTSEPGCFFDLASFREESDYIDGRHPSKVSSSTPLEDAKRRDFTVNALYWDDFNQRLVDTQQGVLDLEFRVLRSVGNAKLRFREDYLRILRLARFAAQLEFKIEPETLAEAAALIDCLQAVSGERIWSELKKIDSHRQWSQALKSDFFISIFEKIFFPIEGRIDLGFAGEFDAILYLYLLLPRRDISEILKQRLHFSRVELKKYKALHEVVEISKKMKTAEFAYAIEKNVILYWAFELLTSNKIMSSESSKNVLLLLQECAEVWISAADLLDFVPARKISEELRSSRISQLNGEYKNKAQLLGKLRKKYAESSEKP